MNIRNTTSLLKALISVHSPSGSEHSMKSFLLQYVAEAQETWACKPQLFYGDDFQDALVLVFGQPKVAAFAHMDTTGFTVRYQDQLVPIGSPEVSGGEQLVGRDSLGEIACRLFLDEEHRPGYQFGRAIASGTTLTYQPYLNDEDDCYTGPYLDNRIGILNLLRVAETMTNGALVFSCWEEHGGGSVPLLVKFLYENYKIRKMLVSDVTWTSDGICHDAGVVISMRDANIPRRSFINKIIQEAQNGGVQHQLEIEGFGASDGREIQLSPYPVDWCFVGAPVNHAHSANEKIAKNDLFSMVGLYKLLMRDIW